MASPTGSGTHSATGAVPKVAFPPFNPDTFSAQLIWLAITFGALYIILSRVALPRVADVLEERRNRINRDLERAQRLKVETEQALAAYEQALASARARASGIAKDTRAALAAQADAEREKVEAAISAKVAEAETRITATKTKALADVNDIATDVAASIVGRLVGASVGADEMRRAVLQSAGR